MIIKRVRGMICFFVGVGAFAFIVGFVNAEKADYSPQKKLEPMLKITWKKGPDLPQGFQDSDGGFIRNILVTVGGYCSGANVDRYPKIASKPKKYPHGFLKKVWGIDISAKKPKWISLPDFIGTARQELFAIPVNNALYMWGGFSYSPPYCYKDGYKLSRKDGQWVWEKLPSLPYPVTSSGICAIGSKIYVMGGADYDLHRFYTNNDRKGKNKRLGSHLLVIDTKDLKSGWKQLSDCPGTPRWVAAVASVKGKIYIFGGATGENKNTPSGIPYCTVVDNWMYDPITGKWTRLRDMPVSSGNFPSGMIVYKDRFILMVGGFQYRKVANPDGTYRDKYGKASKFAGSGAYYNNVFVYDTQKNLFGTATPLPLNNNLPMTVVHKDKIYLIGGEIDSAIVEGEYYWHHPDLFLIGEIKELNRQ